VKRIAVVAFFIALLLVVVPTGADEGMWLLGNLPKDYLKQRYDFDVTDQWVEHVQKSSARLPNCSSSFVSSDGLVFTNGHCAEESVQALSTPQDNLYEKGFYARIYAQELKTDRTLRVLMTTEDVTKEINEAVTKDVSGNPAVVRQKAIINIQNKPHASDLLCEVVVLYQGGQYQNYCYKTYNDVRLVFSTEKNVWFMGGDADNFEYPRYTMDIAFFRVYENGKPAKTPEHFKWSKSGAKEGELVFVSGHPGRTARLLTSSALKTERDVRAPFLLDLFRRREVTLQQFMLKGKEQRRIAESDLFSWQNSRKLYVGKVRGLQDPQLIKAKEDFEKKVISEADPTTRLEFTEGLILVREVQETIREVYPEWLLLVRGLVLDSQLFGGTEGLLSNLKYEEHKLVDSLSHLVEVLGSDNPTVLAMMKSYGNGPVSIAHKIVYEPEVRVKFIEFIKSESSACRQKMEKAVEKERQGYSKISNSLFRMYGTNMYPDATFTLRLSFGTISGYSESGKPISPFTTIDGAYKHSVVFGNSGDYKLPAKWWVRRKSVNLKTKLNFVSNLDITGGNSGSPVFNRNREIVGIVFDSNIEGLVSDYDFNYAPSARAVSVHSAGILEILKKIYRADGLVKELTR